MDESACVSIKTFAAKWWKGRATNTWHPLLQHTSHCAFCQLMTTSIKHLGVTSPAEDSTTIHLNFDAWHHQHRHSDMVKQPKTACDYLTSHKIMARSEWIATDGLKWLYAPNSIILDYHQINKVLMQLCTLATSCSLPVKVKYTETPLAYEARGVWVVDPRVWVSCAVLQRSQLSLLFLFLHRHRRQLRGIKRGNKKSPQWHSSHSSVHVFGIIYVAVILAANLWSLRMTLIVLTSPVDAIPCSALQRKWITSLSYSRSCPPK